MNTKRTLALGLGLLLVLLALGACNQVAELPAVEPTIRQSENGTGSCVAGSFPELVSALDDNACSTITVTTDVTLDWGLILARDVTIEGSGTGVTVRRDPDATYTFRVFDVAPDATVTLRNLTITGGVAEFDVDWWQDGYGGGILNYGDLTLDRCTVSGNRANYAGGIFNLGGTLTIEGSTIADNHAQGRDGTEQGIGGGIFSEGGSVAISGSTIIGNTADVAGGFAISASWGENAEIGVAEITDSTISANRANEAIGGLGNSGSRLTLLRSTISGNEAVEFAGGIANFTDPAKGQHTTILNSTISGNRVGTEPEGTGEIGTYNGAPSGVGGGIYNMAGTLWLSHSTVTDNHADGEGGGVFSAGYYGPTAARTEVKGSIIWGNTSGSVFAPDANDVSASYDFGSEFSSQGHNLIGSHPYANLSTVFNEDGDLAGVDDAEIGDLALNAPGVTETHALLPGSPALDAIAAEDCSATEDQRGVTRPQGSACDIGAFELEASMAYHATGFYEPVGALNSLFVPSGTAPAPGPETIWNVAKGNSTIPLRFNLYAYDGGPEITSTNDIGFSQAPVACPSSSAGDDAVDFTTTGSTSLRYDAASGQFVQNWKTPKVSRDACYRVGVSFPDGSALYAFMRLRK